MRREIEQFQMFLNELLLISTKFKECIPITTGGSRSFYGKLHYINSKYYYYYCCYYYFCYYYYYLLLLLLSLLILGNIKSGV